MDHSQFDDRLSHISTLWTMVLNANRLNDAVGSDSQQALIRRYHRAVYRYLLGAVRRPDIADELFQEFALRFARGGFRSADPDKGRFRDFLRRVLINLIHDWHREQTRRKGVEDVDAAETLAEFDSDQDPDGSFFASWRDELLARAWERLEQQEQRDNLPWHTVLRIRASEPEVRSAEIAARLNESLRPATRFTESGIRKLLQRGREKFADFLIDEVGVSITSADVADIEAELIDLDLLAYCRSALDRRRNTSQTGH